MNNQTAIVLCELKSLLEYVDQFGTHTNDRRVTSARELYENLSNLKSYAEIYAQAQTRSICNNTFTANLLK